MASLPRTDYILLKSPKEENSGVVYQIYSTKTGALISSMENKQLWLRFTGRGIASIAGIYAFQNSLKQNFICDIAYASHFD